MNRVSHWKKREKWWEKSKFVYDLSIDVCFLLNEEFNFGNDNSKKKLLMLQLDIPETKGYIRSIDLLGHEEVFINYYKSVVKHSEKHHLKFKEIYHRFWLRLWIWNKKRNIYIDFPWWDHLNDILKIFKAMNERKEGEVFSYIEQGWMIDLHYYGKKFYMRIGDPDEPQEEYNIKFPEGVILPELEKIENRSTIIIQRFSNALGCDIWTDYSKNQDFKKMILRSVRA